MHNLDMSRVVPVARPVVEAAARVYLRHTDRWLIGLLIHGSALKGGFIPGCSDIDLQIYLKPEAFTVYNQLPLEICSIIQRDLARIDPQPFQYIQGYALRPTPRPRICIGNHFSLMEGHLLLAALAQRASFTLAPGQHIVVDPAHHLTLRPAGAVNVVVKRR